MQNDGDGQPPQAATEPSGRGYKRNGPHSRDRGRVREKLKNPPATVNHLGLLLNLLEEGRRTGRSADTVADFKNLSRTQESAGNGRPPPAAAEPAGRGDDRRWSAKPGPWPLSRTYPESDFKNVLLPRKAELVGRGEEEDGPHIRDLRRVHGILESPPVTDDHFGLLLNLREEARRRTVRTSGTLDEFVKC
ncbi:hypothetical protein pipiens_003910 [Culex pipiens pipiens]|uniref:Uncharacterized protein n=1 Tax=Culex pipiens pipiens TaxID=38569 RepID=A0ABD1CQY9_CULPP